MFEVDPKKYQNRGIPRNRSFWNFFAVYTYSQIYGHLWQPIFLSLAVHKVRWQLIGFFDHLSSYVDIFYLLNVDKKSTFLDYLLTWLQLFLNILGLRFLWKILPKSDLVLRIYFGFLKQRSMGPQKLVTKSGHNYFILEPSKEFNTIF